MRLNNTFERCPPACWGGGEFHSPLIPNQWVKKILPRQSLLPIRNDIRYGLGLVDDFRTFRIEKPDPEFFEFVAA